MAIFGIDLGTTNSLIGLNSSSYLSDLVPSCVDMKTGEAGATQFENMEAERSFKINMSMGNEGVLSRTASKFVLSELARIATKETGIPVKEVCISVPAYFSDSQRAATVEAAEHAGLVVKGLVNEPTAAAMYISREKKSLNVVYDLGGGTFDCSIIDSRFGTYDVQATDGICIGGDNFDNNIVKNFVKEGGVPFHKLNPTRRAELRHFAAKQKIKMQKEREAFFVDLVPFGGNMYLFTPETYIGLMKITFSDTINCMQRLISKWIPSTECYNILLVGGSTHCPYLKEWIEEVTGHDVDALNYDPDRVVAQGAALYAEVVEEGKLGQSVSDVTPALSVGLIGGTCDVIIPANSKIPLTEEKMFTNSERASGLQLMLYQGNHILASANECIGRMDWNYDSVKEPYDCHVLVKVSVDASGIITFSASEDLQPEKSIVLNRNISNLNAEC